MEVLGSVIGSILARPCRVLYGYVHVSIKNFLKRQSNFNALKKDMSSLMHLRDGVQQKLDQQHQLGDVARSQVEDWLGQVHELKKQVDAFLSTISTSDGNNLQYSCSPCPLQCGLSSQLVRKIEEVKQLNEAGNNVFEKLVDASDKTNPFEHIPGPSIIGQKTASKNLASILGLLSDDNVTIIGVWGMGGVGKTTLVKNLNNELGKTTSAQAFSKIIWATASKETSLSRIQIEIAERLNLQVNTEHNEGRMAIRLHERLQKERRFLLILDDVWEEIDLDRLGIPRRELCASSSKIIITSRSFDVCRNMMTQANLPVNVLNYEEAWELFCEHAGEVVMEEHIRPIAEVVAKECDGLPLAIIVVGASMRGKSIVALWEDALRALQMSEPLGKGIEDKVFKTLKWSYDSLQSKPTKFCFIFCCLYPEDFNIRVRELVRYLYCEGLLDERLDYKELENRGIAIIQSLRDCCLLEHGIDQNTVKMHDVVRDVGIWIASSVEDECRSLVRSGIGLTCVSENEFSHSYKYKRVSFMNNKITNLPDCVVQCQEASTLLLQGNWNLETLPASFLEGFQALKILDLSGSRIKSLPSLFQLHQLRTLILCGCRFLTELPPLDGLSRLLVLDCSNSGIIKLPESLEKLSNLRQLDISWTLNLETIPYRAISMLSNLEFLNLSYVGRQMSTEGQRLFEVLPLLKKLIVLYAELDSIPHLTSDNVNWFERVKEFQIVIGDTSGSNMLHHLADNSVILYGLCLSEESIEWLLFNTAVLKFSRCEGITQMFEKWATINVSFARLKVLSIFESDGTFLQPCHGGCAVASFDLLPNLEVIYLHTLSKLESISDLSKLLGLQFTRLKRIVIIGCPELKYIISLEENQTLENVEEIHVASCEMLKYLFDYHNPRAQQWDLMDLNPTVPNLQKLILQNLPNLENLCRNDESWKNLRKLHLFGCHRIRKLPFTAKNAKSIEEIGGQKEWWNQLKWDSDDTKMLLENHFIAIDFPSFKIGPWYFVM